ncbi:MAG: carboxypeptidase M32 [Oscillospiraceae bacterium]|nr:carboxypeptidase M32 [Oscillospiraceae bacterium]
MKFESVRQAVDELKKLQQKQAAYNHAMGVLYLDATTVAPSDSWEGRGKTMEILTKVSYELMTAPEVGELLSYLEEHTDMLDPQTKREAEVLRKGYNQIHRIPAEEYVAYSVLLNEAQTVWNRAKNEDDFDLFAPVLEKIVAYNRKFAGYYQPDMEPYNALLNEYEEGLTMETLDAFFAQLRDTIVPLIGKIQKAEQIDDSFLHRTYPALQQRAFSAYLMDVMGLDKTHCGIGETEHPYTINFNNKDVRITTHYYEQNPVTSMFSVIHEGGHALYELGADDCYNYTALSGGVSMGIHESQSRFYENIIGRSQPFVHAIFPKMKELFPEQLQDVDETMFYRAINRSEPSLIRIEADELTYPLHIMVRYEVEKQLIAGTLEVKDISAEWNRLYKEYLGVDVPSNAKGCLQDSHWSGGSIGYFPSYAIGSAYGPQLLHEMEKDLDTLWQDVAQGDLSRVTAWLKEKIHRHASFHKPGALFASVCGKFDAKYFTDYLTEKFTKLYDL